MLKVSIWMILKGKIGSLWVLKTLLDFFEKPFSKNFPS